RSSGRRRDGSGRPAGRRPGRRLRPAPPGRASASRGPSCPTSWLPLRRDAVYYSVFMARSPVEGPEQLFHFAPAAGAEVVRTKRVLEYAIAYGVKRVVVLSSSYVYGALPDNPFYLNEDFPLNVSRTYPEVRDLAEVDTLATAFLWRHPEVTTAILRPVNTLGY